MSIIKQIKGASEDDCIAIKVAKDFKEKVEDDFTPINDIMRSIEELCVSQFVTIDDPKEIVSRLKDAAERGEVESIIHEINETASNSSVIFMFSDGSVAVVYGSAAFAVADPTSLMRGWWKLAEPKLIEGINESSEPDSGEQVSNVVDINKTVH